MIRDWADVGIEVPYGAYGNIYTTCPQCSADRTGAHKKLKCLSVQVDEKIWHCLHCQWSGSLLSKESTMGQNRDQRPPERQKIYVRPASPIRDPDASSEAVAWLRSRGISTATAKRYGLVPVHHWFAESGAEEAAIAFPIYRDGVLVNTKYRSVEGKHFAMEKEAEVTMVGLDHIDVTMTVIIVEGEVDYLSCAEAEMLNVLSVPNGAPAVGTKGNFAYLDAAMPFLKKIKSFILATDADGPGQYLADELARRLGEARCRKVVWPEGVKDANECLVNSGSDALRSVMADAIPYPIEGTLRLYDLKERYENYRRNGLGSGLAIGIPALDECYRIVPGQLTVITGIPSHGKSAFVDQVAVNMAALHGWVVGVFTPENDPPERYAGELTAKYIGKPFRGGPTEPVNDEEAEEGLLWGDAHFHLIAPERPTLESLLVKADALVGQYGLDGLILDPWNEIESMKPDGLPMTNYIGICLQQIKSFAARHHVHVWLCAHPRKLPTQGQTQAVTDPYDIADSAMFYNKADVIIVVWRDINKPGSDTLIYVKKVRQREAGKLGTIALHYDPPTGRYSNST